MRIRVGKVGTRLVYHYQVSDKMRIGELLLLQEKIDPWVLTNTLKEQPYTRQRLVSLLISRAHLDPDDGALILSEQLGYPAAMQRHLERRDPSLLTLVPPQLGSTWVVLPLGYAKTGALIVVSRDPTPILSAALEHIVRKSVLLAVTPAVQLERLVRAAYGGAGTPDEPLPHSPPTLSDIGHVQLEDATPLPVRRARTVSYMFDGPPQLPVRAPHHVAPIETTLREVDNAITAHAAERHVMAYAAKRWRTALLVRLERDFAIGVRGHGPELEHPEQVRVPLREPSLVSAAAGSRRATQESPSSDTQTHLRVLLGSPATPAAAPIIVGTQVEAVLAVGDPIDHATLAELDRLVDALGAAYSRFARG
ncbi:MAG TPA: hypothetical protein VMZ53_07135 [Kofleriaceae bacterium]|nr:hypothetical protein [Kofleriaceae bacterium]